MFQYGSKSAMQRLSKEKLLRILVVSGDNSGIDHTKCTKPELLEKVQEMVGLLTAQNKSQL